MFKYDPQCLNRIFKGMTIAKKRELTCILSISDQYTGETDYEGVVDIVCLTESKIILQDTCTRSLIILTAFFFKNQLLHLCAARNEEEVGIAMSKSYQWRQQFIPVDQDMYECWWGSQIFYLMD